MRPLKVYEHPQFKAEPEDVSLLTTICFVLAFVAAGAIFILGATCLLFFEDCSTSELAISAGPPNCCSTNIILSAFHVYSARPHVLTLKELLHG